jgi:ADP-ribose pyrophosphatase YjhB (NUDIX family)
LNFNDNTDEHTIASHARPLVTVDDVIISRNQDYWYVILIKRRNEPFANCWTLPGGFILESESPFHAAKRKLDSETNLSHVPLYPIGVFGDPHRDPRGWVISMAFCAVVDRNDVKPFAGDDAAEAEWFKVNWQTEGDVLYITLVHNQYILSAKLKRSSEVTSLGLYVHYDIKENNGIAFDHAKILATALYHLEHNCL